MHPRRPRTHEWVGGTYKGRALWLDAWTGEVLVATAPDTEPALDAALADRLRGAWGVLPRQLRVADRGTAARLARFGHPVVVAPTPELAPERIALDVWLACYDSEEHLRCEPDVLARFSRDEVVPFFERAVTFTAASPYRDLDNYPFLIDVPEFDVNRSAAFVTRNPAGVASLVVSSSFAGAMSMRADLDPSRHPDASSKFDGNGVGVDFLPRSVAPHSVLERISREALPVHPRGIVPMVLAWQRERMSRHQLTVVTVAMECAIGLAAEARARTRANLGIERLRLASGITATVQFPHPEWRDPMRDTLPDY